MGETISLLKSWECCTTLKKVRKKRSEFSSEVLDDWCNTYLNCDLDRILFRAGYRSAVFGVALRGGQQVVIKVREPAAR
jgi:hypothetical protein